MYNASMNLLGYATSAFACMYASQGLMMVFGEGGVLEGLFNAFMMFGLGFAVLALLVVVVGYAFRGLVQVGHYVAEAADSDEYC